MSCYNNILSSTATSAVSGSVLSIIPDTALTPENEQGIKILIRSSTPASGTDLPVSITLGGNSVTVYDKYGNIVYGNQIYDNMVLKGYYGNNGSGNTAHYQLIRLPVRYYYYH